MKKQFLYLTALVITVVFMAGFSSCKKDSSPTALTISTLAAGTIDLNGAIAPNNVPIEPTIVVTFSTDIDPLTATAANITLVRDYDAAPITLTLTASGKTVTIVPAENLASGALHKLTFGSGIKSADGEVLTAAINRTFTTDGFFAPSGMIAYWNFDANANDLVGNFNPSAAIDMTYTASRKTSAGNAATFNGTTSIIEIPNGDQLMNTASRNFTLSFWLKASDVGHDHFVIGLAAFYGFQLELKQSFNFEMPMQFEYADGTTGAAGNNLIYNGDGLTKDNGGWQGTVFCKENTTMDLILKDKWAHIVYVYNNTTKQRIFYLNGELVIKQDFNLWPVGSIETGVAGPKYGGVEPEVYNDLALGFVQSRRGTMWDDMPWGNYDLLTSNHFKGQLDDIRIFDKPVSDAEVLLMYNSEKP